MLTVALSEKLRAGGGTPDFGCWDPSVPNLDHVSLCSDWVVSFQLTGIRQRWIAGYGEMEIRRRQVVRALF